MITVSLEGNSIKIARDAGNPAQAETPPTYIPVANILHVGGYFQKNTSNGLGNTPYAYGKRTPGRTTKTIVIIKTEASAYSFDCDETTTVAWQGCTLAALEQALTDINAWL